GTGGESGTGGSGGYNAIAMLTSELPPPGTGGGGTTSSVATGPGPDPNQLSVFVTFPGQNCADPFLSSLGCSELTWGVVFDLTPAQQVPGTYSMQEVNGYFFESYPNPTPNQCSGGGGSFVNGTVQITRVNGQEVRFTLSGTETSEFDAN